MLLLLVDVLRIVSNTLGPSAPSRRQWDFADVFNHEKFKVTSTKQIIIKHSRHRHVLLLLLLAVLCASTITLNPSAPSRRQRDFADISNHRSSNGKSSQFLVAAQYEARVRGGAGGLALLKGEPRPMGLSAPARRQRENAETRHLTSSTKHIFIAKFFFFDYQVTLRVVSD
jgi:hypothetical protein